MFVSVIIPTYNRKDWLYETLTSLTQQTWPTDHFEVIVVNDGSTDDTAEIIKEEFPFTLRYFWQTNQGDAAARNLGVEQSQADVLVFLDDDILIEPDYLAFLVREHTSAKNRIVVGTEHLWIEDTNPLTQSVSTSKVSRSKHLTEKIAFTDVCSNNMSIRREAYETIGMMQGLDFPGSSIWCDVDFSYRAYKQGFEFLRSTGAVCYHRDYVALSLDNSKTRVKKVAYRATALFQKHPDLLPHIPMFHDKTPISWGQDKPLLVMRKLARHVASSYLALSLLETLATILERTSPSSPINRSLHRWIMGGHIFRGYREGLQDFGPIQQKKEVA